MAIGETSLAVTLRSSANLFRLKACQSALSGLWREDSTASMPAYQTTFGCRLHLNLRCCRGVSGRTCQTVFGRRDRKSTRLNSSHSQISYAVFCLKKKKDHATLNFNYN